jgi:alginate O-acetyltransferase complex protein AlgI
MVQRSIFYALFLGGVLLVYWSAPNRATKLWVMLVSSLAFYGTLQAQYVPLLLVLVGLNFALGKALGTPLDWRIPNEAWQYAEADWHRRRVRLLWLGIVLNTALLLGFKYFVPTVQRLGLEVPALDTATEAATGLSFLGLSFFTFECIAYLVDVYRGSPASDRPLEFAAYKLFFPKLISGPITRFHSFAGQIKKPTLPPLSQSTEGLWLIACGTVKKLLIADQIGLLVNLSAGSLPRAGSGDIWLMTFAYGLQLYLDFSGYVDMARGSALLLGINLPQNFNFPYFSTSIADFWRRWHITLGDWLRNYLYFPLGGSRGGLVRTCLNLMVVMLIAGVWHGDRWGFVVWGGIHGLALIAHRLSASLSERSKWLAAFWTSGPGIVTAWGMTQFVVFFSWIFFRLPNLSDAGLAMRHLFGHAADIQFAQKVYYESFGLNRPQISLLLAAVALLMAVAYAFQRGLKLQLSWPIKVLLLPVCFYLAWMLAPGEASPYIYFDF